MTGLKDTLAPDWQDIEDWLTGVIAGSFYAHWDAIDGARAIVARIKDGDFPGHIAPLPKRGLAEPRPGSNEWLAQSPLFHPGDLA